MKVLILISLLVTLVFASVGRVTGIKGKAKLIRELESLNLTLGYKLEKKDIIKTADKSKVQIIFDDNTIVTIGKKSSLDIEDYLYDTVSPKKSKVKLKFFRGAFKSITGKIGKVAPERFKLKTKNATIGIRGTVLAGNQNRVVCEQGSITVSSNGITQIVPAGMMSMTPPDAPPTPAVVFKASAVSLEDEAEQEEEKEKAKAKEEKSEDKKEKSDNKEEKSEDKKNESDKKDEKPKDKQQVEKKEETKSSEKSSSTKATKPTNEQNIEQPEAAIEEEPIQPTVAQESESPQERRASPAFRDEVIVEQQETIVPEESFQPVAIEENVTPEIQEMNTPIISNEVVASVIASTSETTSTASIVVNETVTFEDTDKR